ncbi:pyridoxamine 5'-phosphate oxidase family protein [Paenibacillus antibioticophila]|uniref:pyridoxamine 5'-phosphate oxidase family protein n=1 Tax=Paenibacillus antibioticophila TaxID=1274374 RepID=UPI0009DBF7CF|nr:pyridoxamine 5'-phosphate oxidase family protein [Paenibacillus antibioticophila]
MMNNQEHREAVETVSHLIKGIEIAMLITVTEEGPVSRPMEIQEVEFAENPLFPTKSDTDKCGHLQQHPEVKSTAARD